MQTIAVRLKGLYTAPPASISSARRRTRDDGLESTGVTPGISLARNVIARLFSVPLFSLALYIHILTLSLEKESQIATSGLINEENHDDDVSLLAVSSLLSVCG